MNDKITIKNKKNASLARRLTASQTWRLFRAFIWLDFTLCAVFLFALAFQAETAVAADIRGQSAGHLPLVSGFEKIEEVAPAWGWRAPMQLERYLAMPDGTRRSISNSTAGTHYSDLRWLFSLRYDLCVPTKILNHQLLYSVNIGVALFWFGAGMIGLTALEAVWVLFTVPAIGRSTKKILRPINELTFAAQTMNASQAVPQIEKLQLSGAIDQLNAITENHMDARISIADEREELRGLASAINNMLDRLDAAYRSQLRFVSDASHELRTPIAVIQGYANMLDRWGKEDADTLMEGIEAIKSEAENMKGLVEQLLFLARSDNRTIVLAREPVDISALVEEILRETRMIDLSHTFEGKIDPGLVVCGDAQLLKQAIRIFVDNSIKYSPAGGEISLRVQAREAYVQIAVTDGGIGIAPKDIPLVFERFYRSDESRARKTGGTGLGLSIAKWIIDEHGGIVEVVSRENLGTRVAFLLPGYEGKKMQRAPVGARC